MRRSPSIRKPTVSEYSSRCSYAEGRDAERAVQIDDAVCLQIAELDVACHHQLAPWAVALEKVAHARHGVDGQALRTKGLLAELHQSGIVPGVGMGEQHTGWQKEGIPSQESRHPPQLLTDVGRGLQKPVASVPPVDKGE